MSKSNGILMNLVMPMDLNLRLLEKIHAGAEDHFGNDDTATSHIAILRSWIDTEDPEKLAYVYDPDDKRIYDRLFTYDQFLENCKGLIEYEQEESYFSINSFWKKKKNTDDIRHLNAFALDFDYYKIKDYSDLDPPSMYAQHIKPVLQFEPTAVVDSGRGLYIIYAFHHCSILRLKLYKSIYKQFLKLYEGLGMDSKATNVTQVIRIPGTYNVNAGKPVEILEYNETKYELTDFTSLLPYTLEETKAYKKKRAKEYLDRELKPVAADKAVSRKKSCKELVKDLRKLIALRNHAKIYEGYREQLLYIALEKMLWAGYSKDEAIKMAEDLNQEFHEPLSTHAVERQCMPAKIYFKTHSTASIISKLSIRDEEQQSLAILQTRRHQDLHRKRLRNKHPLLNRTMKEVELLKRRTEVLHQKKQGRRNIDIANSLQVDKSTITKDLQYISKNKHEFRKVLAETIEALVASLQDVHFVRSITYDVQKQLRMWLKISPEVLSDP